MRIHLPNSAWIGNIDPFLKSFDALEDDNLYVTSHEEWVSVHPVVLCMIVSLGLSVRNNEGTLNFKTMTAKSKHYLERMNVFGLLGLKSEMTIKKHEPSGRFIPMAKIKNSQDLNNFITEMIPLLHKEPRQVEPIRYVISELVRNVFEHSKSKDGALVCAQFYKKSNMIRIGVVDSGIGIKKSINHSYPEAENDLHAIRLALTPGITGTTRKIGGTEANAGAGLFFIKSIAKVNRDFFMIYSGNSMFKLLKTKQNKEIKLNANPFEDNCSKRSDLPHWQGTVVAIDISLNTNRDFEVFLELIRNAYRQDLQEIRKIKFKKPRFS